MMTPAHPLERVLAWLIDMIVLVLPRGLLVALLGETGPGLIATFLCDLAYFSWLNGGRWQATVGQRVLGIRAIRNDGRALSLRDATERFLAFILPFLPVYASFLPKDVGPYLMVWLIGLWLVPILVSPKRLGMHDRLSRTQMVAGRVK